jgi:hypothetical protein
MVSDAHVEGETAIGVGDRTYDSHPCMSIEQVMAYNEGGPSAFLLMPGLWIKGDRDEIPLSGDIGGHLQGLLAYGFAPFDFFGPIVRWNAAYQVPKIDSASSCGGHNDDAVLHRYIHRIPHGQAGVLYNLPG